jgi:hypothetical protein
VPSSGPKYPGSTTVVDRGTTSVWANVANIVSSNDTYATVLLGDSTPDPVTSDWLVAYNFGFALPSTTVSIDGYVVEIECKTSRVNAAYPNWIHVWLTQDAGANQVGANQGGGSGGAMGTTEVQETFGSSSNVWGTALTYSDVNNSNFGVRMYCSNNGGGGFDDYTISVDGVRMTIHYTDAAGQPTWTRRGGLWAPGRHGRKVGSVHG